MARYRDNRSAGRSDRCPFIPGEEASRRHHRRKRQAESDEQRLRRYCDRRDLELSIRNEGHHWIISSLHDKRFRAEWFPSTAKLIFNQDWERGIHVHDVNQVMQEIDNRLSPSRQKTGKLVGKKTKTREERAPGKNSRFSQEKLSKKKRREKLEYDAKKRGREW